MDFDVTGRGEPRPAIEMPSTRSWTNMPVSGASRLRLSDGSVWLLEPARVSELTSGEPSAFRRYDGVNALAGVSEGRPWLYRAGGRTFWHGQRKAFTISGRVADALALDDRILVTSGPEARRITQCFDFGGRLLWERDGSGHLWRAAELVLWIHNHGFICLEASLDAELWGYEFHGCNGLVAVHGGYVWTWERVGSVTDRSRVDLVARQLVDGGEAKRIEVGAGSSLEGFLDTTGAATVRVADRLIRCDPQGGVVRAWRVRDREREAPVFVTWPLVNGVLSTRGGELLAFEQGRTKPTSLFHSDDVIHVAAGCHAVFVVTAGSLHILRT